MVVSQPGRDEVQHATPDVASNTRRILLVAAQQLFRWNWHYTHAYHTHQIHTATCRNPSLEVAPTTSLLRGQQFPIQARFWAIVGLFRDWLGPNLTVIFQSKTNVNVTVNFWPMTLNFENDLNINKRNQQVLPNIYHKSHIFIQNLLFTHTDTHTHMIDRLI